MPYLPPTIEQVQTLINNRKLEVEWITTGVFTPLTSVRLRLSKVDLHGRKISTRIRISPGYIYIADKTRGIYLRYPSIESAIRSRVHTLENYGFRAEEGEIPKLETILDGLNDILFKLDQPSPLYRNETDAIQRKLNQWAVQLERVKNQFKKKAQERFAKGLLDSLNRLNKLISQSRLKLSRRMILERFIEHEGIIPQIERQKRALEMAHAGILRHFRSARSRLTTISRNISIPNTCEALRRTWQEELSGITIQPFSLLAQWAGWYMAKAARIAPDVPATAQERIQTAICYLTWPKPKKEASTS